MQDSRLLSILLILSNKEMITAKELAQHFEVSLRTIYRDINKLSIAGIPIMSIGGKGGGYQLMENYQVDHLFFNEQELKTVMSLIDGLKVMFGKNKALNDIVLKLQNTYRLKGPQNKLQIDLSHFSMEHELKDYLYSINQAIENKQLVIFDYTNRRLEEERRLVEPMQISYQSGNWFLVGYCLNRKDYRNFKLVRMSHLTIGEPFSKRPITSEELNELFKTSLAEDSLSVELKFKPEFKNHLTEYFDKSSITEIEDGFVIHDAFPYDEGLIKFILSFGTVCEVIKPQFLREEIKNYLNHLIEKYND